MNRIAPTLIPVPAPMLLDFALTTPLDELTDRQIDVARLVLGGEKLRIRRDAKGPRPFRWENARTFTELKPMTVRIIELNAEMEWRQCRGRRPA